jgi:hypothetical protein
LSSHGISLSCQSGLDVIGSLAERAIPSKMALSDLHRKIFHMSIEVLDNDLFLEMRNFFCHLINPSGQKRFGVVGF